MFRPALIVLSLTLSLQANAGLLSRWIKKIPVTEALETFGSARDRELDGNSIKVLVWNIKKAEMKPWATEFGEYARGKDIFLVQEAYDVPRMVEEISSIEGYRWDLGRSFEYVRYNHGTGTMVGSRAEPEEVIVTQTPDHEPILNTPKAMTFAKYGLDNSDKSLLVISIHAINFRELAPFKRNLAQAKAEIDKHDGPVLFAGDFNTHLKERTNYLVKMMKEMNFTEITWINGNQRMKAPVTGNFLDHGFVRGLTVKHAECLGNSRGSDHRPLVIELAAETN